MKSYYGCLSKVAAALFLLVIVTGCQVFTVAEMLVNNGGYKNLGIRKNGISIEQRYDAEFNPNSAIPSVIFGRPIDRSDVSVRSYYRIASGSFDRYGEFSAIFKYKCKKGHTYEEVVFTKNNLTGEVRGSGIRVTSHCDNRPLNYDIVISDAPYNSSYASENGDRLVGSFSEGSFRRGMVVHPSGKIEFGEYDKFGKAQGRFTMIEEDGTVKSIEYEDGAVSGEAFIVSADGESGFFYYDDGEENTENYILDKAKGLVNSQFEDELKRETASIDRVLTDIHNKMESYEATLESPEFQKQKKLINRHWGGNNCSMIGFYLVQEDPDLSAHESMLAEQRRKARDAAKRKICYAMNQLGHSLSGSTNGDYSSNIENLLKNADLSKLDPKSHQSLISGIAAYRELDKLKPIRAQENRRKREKEAKVRADQESRRQQLLAQKTAEYESMKLKEAAETKRRNDAIRRCFDAAGFGPYSEWFVIPIDHYCEGPEGWSRY